MTLVSRPSYAELVQGSEAAAARMGHAATAARLQRDPMHASYSMGHASRKLCALAPLCAVHNVSCPASATCSRPLLPTFSIPSAHPLATASYCPMHPTTTTGWTGSRLMPEPYIRSNDSLCKFWITFCRACETGHDQYKAAVEAFGGDDAANARIIVLPLRSLYGS